MTDTPKPDRISSYEGGIAAILRQMNGRRDALTYGDGEALPPVDVDLEALKSQIVLHPDQDKSLPRTGTSFSNKRIELRRELAGQNELVYLHAMLIANLRKVDQPAHCAALFVRLWAEQGDYLIKTLNLRWQVSAISTFAEHGTTEIQRRVGYMLHTMFAMMKLYETERRYSGFSSDKAFTLPNRDRSPLPMEMDAFSIDGGGLDVNLLGRMWIEAEDDSVIQPLAHHLLDELIHDPRGLFHRLKVMRYRFDRRNAKKSPEEAVTPIIIPVPAVDPGPKTWGIVLTAHALDDWPAITRSVARHLKLGAEEIHLYLDDPNRLLPEQVITHPNVQVVPCDEAHWANIRPRLRQTFEQRKILNASVSYGQMRTDFIAHLDICEILMPSDDIALILGDLAPDLAYSRMAPAELMPPLHQDEGLRYFKRSTRAADQREDVLDDLFPTYAKKLNFGLLSAISGKVFCRTGLAELEMGNHAIRYKKQEPENGTACNDIDLGVLNFTNEDEFMDNIQTLLDKGAFQPNASLADEPFQTLRKLSDDNNQEALREFYAEVAAAHPKILESLRKNDMLITNEIDPDADVLAIFGIDIRAVLQ